MELKNILHQVDYIKAYHLDKATELTQLVFDSRKVIKGCVFIAQKGVAVDGHQFIDMAIEKGATVVVCEVLPTKLLLDIVYILVKDAQETLALMANNFYDQPSSQLKLIGVTGTNGKTTIASLLYQLFKSLGYKVGLLSTVKVLVDDDYYPATHTTPDSIAINQYLQLMIEKGVDYCFMEVSSHGIHQKRTYGLNFTGGIFTNLTHDHLDYHDTFSEYRDVKKSFFDHLNKFAFAITNLDDKNGSIMLQNTKAARKSYAQKQVADYKVKIIEKSFEGMLLEINGQQLWSQLVGRFNASNIAAIYATAKELGVATDELLLKISQLQSVDGRFEYQKSTTGIVTVVDYAHTPDALKNILETIQDLVPATNSIITVVGCGGNRDKAKRPVMANIASMLSHQVVLTSDNPRNEIADQIITDMEVGVSAENQHKVLSITDRKQAIVTACKLAKSGDVILVAGKGHEDYQEVNGVKTHFNDKEVLAQTLITQKK